MKKADSKLLSFGLPSLTVRHSLRVVPQRQTKRAEHSGKLKVSLFEVWRKTVNIRRPGTRSRPGTTWPRTAWPTGTTTWPSARPGATRSAGTLIWSVRPHPHVVHREELRL